MDAARTLIRCPMCESALIQLEAWHLLDIDLEATLVERRCPECGHRGELVLPHAVFALLRQHHAGLCAYLADLADRLESAEELRIVE